MIELKVKDRNKDKLYLVKILYSDGAVILCRRLNKGYHLLIDKSKSRGI